MKVELGIANVADYFDYMTRCLAGCIASVDIGE